LSNLFLIFVLFADSDAQDVNWLKCHLEPWPTITEKWQSTAGARKSMRGQKRFDVTEYLNDFKCLRQPSGHLLVSYYQYTFSEIK